MAIGDYVHGHYENYLIHGLTIKNNQGVGEDSRVSQNFINEIVRLKEQVKKRNDSYENFFNKKQLENQLNSFFSAKKGNISEETENKLTAEQVKEIEEAVTTYLGDKIQGANITNTLGAVSFGKELQDKVLKEQNKSEQEFLNILQRGKVGGSSKQAVLKSTINDRINALLGLRDQIGQMAKGEISNKLIQDINNLNREWEEILKITEGKLIYKNQNNNADFIKNLNSLIRRVISGSPTTHGLYAEAIIALIPYVLNENIKIESKNLVEILKEKTPSSLLQGQNVSRNKLLSSKFSSIVNLDDVVANKNQKKIYTKDSEGNYISANVTQDKIDINIAWEGLRIPASVKNYNLGNSKYTDVHLLNGRSLLVLLQDQEEFLNHYMNVAGQPHLGEREPSKDNLIAANRALTASVFIKAIQGGIATDKGYSGEAELFIINDNSIGQFKVYTINDLLALAMPDANKDSEYIKIEKDFGDTLQNDTSAATASQRISKLLNQLHSSKIKVSIDKKIFNLTK